MPTTPVYAFPYPAPTDPADGPVGFQNLATAVEAAIGAAAPGSSLPASPVDGQVARLKVGTNGPVWTFQYLAASAAPNRWHFLGGGDLVGQDATGFATATALWVAATTGPALAAVPRAGDYEIDVSADITSASADGIAGIGAGVNAATPATAAQALILCRRGDLYFALTKRFRLALPAAAVVSAFQIGLVGGSTSSFRHLSLRPIAVA